MTSLTLQQPQSLKMSTTLSLERKLLPLELLTYRLMYTSAKGKACAKQKHALQLKLISQWLETFHVPLSTAKKMGILQSLVHHQLYHPHRGSAATSKLFAMPSSQELLICRTYVRPILSSWPDTLDLQSLLSETCVPLSKSPPLIFDLGKPSWWNSQLENLLPVKSISWWTNPETQAKPTLQTILNPRKRKFK